MTGARKGRPGGRPLQSTMTGARDPERETLRAGGAAGGPAPGIALAPLALIFALGHKKATAAVFFQQTLAIYLLGKPAQHLLKTFAVTQLNIHAVAPFTPNGQPIATDWRDQNKIIPTPLPTR